MMMTTLPPPLVFLFVAAASSSFAEECAYEVFSPRHVMCRTPTAAEESGFCRGIADADGGAAAAESLTELHNRGRGRLARGEMTPLPSAANMRTLTWDDELASLSLAQSLARCSSDEPSSSPADRDECVECGRVSRFSVRRLFYDSVVSGAEERNEESPSPPWRRAVDEWFRQLGQLPVSLLANFTDDDDEPRHAVAQLASARTSHFGCGATRRTTTTNNEDDNATTVARFFVVCNYGPSGLAEGFPVYEEGTKPCSRCPSGTECDEGSGLCAGKVMMSLERVAAKTTTDRRQNDVSRSRRQSPSSSSELRRVVGDVVAAEAAAITRLRHRRRNNNSSSTLFSSSPITVWPESYPDYPLVLSCDFDGASSTGATNNASSASNRCRTKSIGTGKTGTWKRNRPAVVNGTTGTTAVNRYYETTVSPGGNALLFVLNGIPPTPNATACLRVKYRKRPVSVGGSNSSSSSPSSVALKVFSWSMTGPPIESAVVDDAAEWTRWTTQVDDLRGYAIVFFHVSVPDDHPVSLYASVDDVTVVAGTCSSSIDEDDS